MRIAFIVGQFPTISETFILNQITGLMERGHEVDIYSLQGRPAETKMHPSIEEYHLLPFTYYVPSIPKNYFWRGLKGLGLLIGHGFKAPRVCWRALNVFRFGKKAASLNLLYTAIPALGQKPYDIIHCQFGIYALDGLALKQIGALQGKLISSFRGRDISWYVKNQGEQVYDQLLKVGDFFLANCEFFRRRVIALGCDKRKVIVHGSGIDCRKFVFSPRSPRPDSQLQIVTTGRLVEKKGIEYGIRAVAQLVEDYPHLTYAIIGDGELRQSLQQLIQDLGIPHRIKLLGWKNQPEVIEILSRSQIFLAPCVTAENGNQDAPVNVLKEAMAMGLPTIATQHGGIPELVEDGVSGFLVPERNVNAIAEKLRYLIEHPQLWPLMGRAGRARVEECYDMNQLNDELVTIYQQLLDGKLPQPRIPVTSVYRCQSSLIYSR